VLYLAPIFSSPSEIGGNNKYIYNTPRKLSDIGFERFSRMILPENSIIVTCIGSDMGKVVLNTTLLNSAIVFYTHKASNLGAVSCTNIFICCMAIWLSLPLNKT
jgi:hypothetical protein